ncbi:hypothetical protein GCM10009743_65210 [Kribbella swartbergensis]
MVRLLHRLEAVDLQQDAETHQSGMRDHLVAAFISRMSTIKTGPSAGATGCQNGRWQYRFKSEQQMRARWTLDPPHWPDQDLKTRRAAPNEYTG